MLFPFPGWGEAERPCTHSGAQLSVVGEGWGTADTLNGLRGTGTAKPTVLPRSPHAFPTRQNLNDSIYNAFLMGCVLSFQDKGDIGCMPHWIGTMVRDPQGQKCLGRR